MKRLICIAIMLIVTAATLTGCFFYRENPYPYRGEYKELYTAAIYSIPDAVGYMHHGEGAYNSAICVWEQDDYGRTLFSYCEDYSDQIFGLVVCQSYDETNVYFYPDDNYILTLIESEYCYEGVEKDHLKNKTEAFYTENKEKLKADNDWNKPLDKSKCVSYPITDHKILDKNTKELSSTECDKILNEYSATLNLSNPEKSPHRYNNILQVDAEGNVLHEIYGVHRHYDNPDWKETDEYTWYSITLWVITDKNGNYDKENGIMVMYSKANESDKSFVYDSLEVKEFKSRNNWKYNYEN